jgi:hypothetical protein
MEIETILYNMLGACTCLWHKIKHMDSTVLTAAVMV